MPGPIFIFHSPGPFSIQFVAEAVDHGDSFALRSATQRQVEREGGSKRFEWVEWEAEVGKGHEDVGPDRELPIDNKVMVVFDPNHTDLEPRIDWPDE